MQTGVAAALYVLLSFLVWVGYSWPEDEVVVKVRGTTAGRLQFSSDEPARLLLWTDQDWGWLDELHPDLWERRVDDE